MNEPDPDPRSTEAKSIRETPVVVSSVEPPIKRSWPQLPALSDRVDILFELERIDSTHVRMNGKTNLPAGTHLMTSITGTHERLGHSAKVDVQQDGTFTATYGRVRDGQYTAEVLMPIVAMQPAATQSILGKEGENISGPLRERGKFGVVVRRVSEANISRGNITGDYSMSQETNGEIDPDQPSKKQWAEWMSDNDLAEKKKIYLDIQRAWEASDKKAQKQGLLAKREQLSETPVDLAELDRVEKQIEEIEEQEFRKLAQKLEIPFHYLRAINMKGASDNW